MVPKRGTPYPRPRAPATSGVYLPAPSNGILQRAAFGMDVRLIQEVSRWPILYNTSCEEYKNVEMKNHAWRDITTNLFGSYNPIIVEKVKNKWKNLRDTFVKSQKKKDRPNSKPWKLEGEMKFLIPHINPKVPFTNHNMETLNLSMDRRYTSSPEEFKNENSPWEVDLIKKERLEEDLKQDILQHVETVMEDTPSRRQGNLAKRRKRKESLASPVPAGVHFMDNGEQMFDQSPSPIPYDSVDYFFLGLASSVKRMRPMNQITLKRAIANLVFDAEMKELEVSNNYEATSSSELNNVN